MRKKLTTPIPNIITLLNLLSGTVAIIFAFNPRGMYGLLWGWQMCAIMIAAAAVFDFLDGFSARLLHAKSAIGKELDSLSDLVSFGVAPGFLMLNVMLEANGGWMSYISLFIPMMGAMRLAKFNVDEEQATVFKGLPIPANAIFWIGLVGGIYHWEPRIRMTVMVVTVVAVSLLMISNLRMFSLKFKDLKLRGNIDRFILILGTIASVAIFGVAGLAIAIVLYILISVWEAVVTVTYE